MRDERAYLWDMRESAQLATGYVAGKSREAFEADLMLQDAVVRRLSIIGEAAKKISPATRSQLPGLPFDEMARMRDVMTHVYWRVKLDILWDTAVDDLPRLIATLATILPADPPPGEIAPGVTS